MYSNHISWRSFLCAALSCKLMKVTAGEICPILVGKLFTSRWWTGHCWLICNSNKTLFPQHKKQAVCPASHTLDLCIHITKWNHQASCLWPSRSSANEKKNFLQINACVQNGEIDTTTICSDCPICRKTCSFLSISQCNQKCQSHHFNWKLR